MAFEFGPPYEPLDGLLSVTGSSNPELNGSFQLNFSTSSSQLVEYGSNPGWVVKFDGVDDFGGGISVGYYSESGNLGYGRGPLDDENLTTYYQDGFILEYPETDEGMEIQWIPNFISGLDQPPLTSNQYIPTQEIVSVNKDHPLTRGLISWNIVLPNTSGGNYLYDISGNQNHGTINSTAKWVGRENGGGVDTQSTGLISINSVAAKLAARSEFTISFWAAKFGGSEALNAAFTLRPSPVNASKTLIIYPYDSPNGHIFYNAVFMDVVGLAKDGQWNHFVFTNRSSTDHRYFINGVEYGSSSTSKTLSGDISVLEFGLYPAQTFEGLLDNLMIYDRGLSDLEINGLYHEGLSSNPNLLNRLNFYQRSYNYDVVEKTSDGKLVLGSSSFRTLAYTLSTAARLSISNLTSYTSQYNLSSSGRLYLDNQTTFSFNYNLESSTELLISNPSSHTLGYIRESSGKLSVSNLSTPLFGYYRVSNGSLKAINESELNIEVFKTSDGQLRLISNGEEHFGFFVQGENTLLLSKSSTYFKAHYFSSSAGLHLENLASAEAFNLLKDEVFNVQISPKIIFLENTEAKELFNVIRL